MSKKVLSFLSLVAIPALAQTPSLQWEKNINGQLSGYDYTQNSWKDPNGNFFLTGASENDAFVMKIDNNGNQLTRIIWDGPKSGYDQGNVIRADASGNIYIAGLTAYGPNNVPFVVKFNSAGVKLWEYVQTTVTVSGAVTAMALDNYTNPGNIYFTGSKNDSSAIIKINVNTGISVWEKTFWPHGKMNDVDIDNNGHPLVCGYQAFSGLDADLFAGVLDINTGFPLRGYWRDGAAVDSVNDPGSHFDMGAKIKAGPAGTFAILGTIYNTSNAATILVAKFGSVGNNPIWTYTYDSPNHTEGMGVQLLADVSFNNFYYLAGASSTLGTYYRYTIAGKVNNSGTGLWEKESFQNGMSLDPKDMAIDANGSAHIISDMVSGFPQDIYYQKLSSGSGGTLATLQYDNQRGAGFAGDYSSNIFVDNTGHPYIIGSSNAFTYTVLDVLICRLNTNATLDWDITYDFFANAQDFTFNVQALPISSGADQIVTCGTSINNITSLDASITSYSESGTINWQATFDDNNGSDQVVGFEKSMSNNLFLCTNNNSNGVISVTEFYPDGTTNFSAKPGWTFTPKCFKIDSAENSFVSGSVGNTVDFAMGIYLRTGITVTGVPMVVANMYTSPYSMTTDNTYIYVLGTIQDYAGQDGGHAYIQKIDQSANVIWSTKIMGFDSSAFNSIPKKIVFDRASGALYAVGLDVSVGSSVRQTVLAKINTNGTVAWVRKENSSNTRYQFMNDIKVANGKIYISGYAYNVSSMTDNFLLTEEWDVNGNKQWEYIFDKTNTDEQGASIAVDNAGNVFIGGKTNGQPSSTVGSDMLLVKLNPAGNLMWAQEYNGVGSGADECANIALSNTYPANPRIYMCGNTQSTQGYYFDIGTLKYCDMTPATVSYTGSTSICQNTTIVLGSSVSGAGNIIWNNGTSGGTVVTITSGDYYFTYTEMDGCAENSDTVSINFVAPPLSPSICMVTVDSTSAHNIIYWDKTSFVGTGVIGFKIYREDLTNVYTYIGSVPFANLSEYMDIDPSADPNVTTKRYKISAIDSCGNESQLSNYHNTIYIVSNGSGQFSWNQLYTIEGGANPVNNYILLRDDYNTGNWQQVAITAGTQFNINDINFSTFQPTASWRVATSWAISCTPTAKMGSGNSTQTTIIKSKSNITNNRAAGIQSGFGNMKVAVYPNPAQSMLTVNFTQSAKTSLKLRSLLGEEVIATDVLNESTSQLDISKLATGVYLLEVSNASGKFVQRIVKE